MKYTQYLIFEICRECNLANKHHRQCPSGDPTRYGRLLQSHSMTDNDIIDAAVDAYSAREFRGMLGWHYYNEPCLAIDRIETVLERIRRTVPQARSVLWTNATKLPEDLDRLRIFQQLWVSNYAHRDWSHLRQYVPDLHLMPAELDARNTPRWNTGFQRCLRPFNELIIDYYGNGHLCCMDWRGDCYLGNVLIDGFQYVAEQFIRVRDQVMTEPMPAEAPVVCRTCAFRFPDRVAELVPKIANDAQAYADAGGRPRQ